MVRSIGVRGRVHRLTARQAPACPRCTGPRATSRRFGKWGRGRRLFRSIFSGSVCSSRSIPDDGVAPPTASHPSLLHETTRSRPPDQASKTLQHPDASKSRPNIQSYARGYPQVKPDSEPPGRCRPRTPKPLLFLRHPQSPDNRHGAANGVLHSEPSAEGHGVPLQESHQDGDRRLRRFSARGVVCDCPSCQVGRRSRHHELARRPQTRDFRPAPWRRDSD